MRVLRVVRIFGKFKSLRKIVAALTLSIAPMTAAFFVLFILASLCPAPPLRFVPADWCIAV